VPPVKSARCDSREHHKYDFKTAPGVHPVISSPKAKVSVGKAISPVEKPGCFSGPAETEDA